VSFVRTLSYQFDIRPFKEDFSQRPQRFSSLTNHHYL
jgi:hypothetical protein